jgi:hypothetical protein
MMQQSPLIEKLHDIHEIDQISKWPLGIGWWVVIGMLSIGIFIFLVWCLKQSIYKKTWKYKAWLELSCMQKQIKNEHISDNYSGKSYLNQFNNLLRKIVVHKFPRNECAHLVGDKWLVWLTNNDPKKYNWSRHKNLLINMPYSDNSIDFNSNEFIAMLHALKKWIK